MRRLYLHMESRIMVESASNVYMLFMDLWIYKHTCLTFEPVESCVVSVLYVCIYIRSYFLTMKQVMYHR